MRAFKYLLLPLTLFSCSQGVEETRLTPGDSATFVVDQILGSGEDGTADSTFSNIPVSRLVNFSACLKDVAVLEPVVGATFRLMDGKREIPLKSPSTDAKGCLYWTEDFPYQATRQETYFELQRTIEAVSVHKGAVPVRLAVNPWKKGGEAVKDLRFQTAPSTMDRSRLQQGQGTAPGLVIETVQADMEIGRSSDAVAEADLQLSFQPLLRRIGIDGAQILEPLTSGKFDVKVQILAVEGNRTIPLTSVAEFTGNYFQKGNIQLRSKVKILRKIPRESSLELAFEAIPREAPDGLGPVRGKVTLGRLTSLSLSRSAPLFPEQDLEFQTPPALSKEESGLFAFELGKVRSSDVVVKELDGTGRPRIVEVEFTACLRNTFSQEKILGQEFSVHLEEFSRTLPTDPEGGCLKWKQSFSFDYHGPEILLAKELEITSANSFYGEEKVKRTLHLNLWQYEQPDKMVIDEQFDGPPTPGVAAGGSEMILASAFYSFMGRKFEVDSHLNLTTIRKYRFDLQPKIRRMSRNSGWLPAQGPGNGRYLVRFLLETMDPDNPQVVDAQTVEAVSSADTLPVTVEFRVNDIRLVTTRLNLSIEVLPVDRASSLQTSPYRGAFDMMGFSLRLAPRGSRIENRMKSASIVNPALKRRSRDIFLEAKKYTEIKGALLSQIETDEAELEKLLQPDIPDRERKKIAGKLCGLFYEKPSWYSLFPTYPVCVRSPDAFFHLLPTEHAKEIVTSRITGTPVSSAINMSAGISYSQYESQDRTKSHSWGVNAEAGAKLSLPLSGITGLNVGIGMGYSESWTTSESYTKGSSRNETRSSDLSRQLAVEEMKFEMTGSVDQCLLIGNKYDPDDKRVFAFCAREPRQKTFQEDYFLVYQWAENGPLLDSGANLNERPFITLMRGRPRFLDFVRVARDAQATINLTRTPPAPAAVMKEAEGRFDGYFPGLLTPAQ